MTNPQKNNLHNGFQEAGAHHRDTPQLGVYVDGGALGDMLGLLPIIRVLHRYFPDHRICWITGYGSSPLKTILAPLADGLIDEFIDQAGIGTRWNGIAQRPLAGRRFDIIIDCQTRLRISVALRRIRPRIFVSGAVSFLLSNRRPPALRRPAAVFDRVAQLVGLAAGQVCQPDFRCNVPQHFREAAARYLPDGPIYVGIAPGAGDRRKCWPLAKFISLAQQLAGNGRVPVFLLGPAERNWLPEIQGAVAQARFPGWDNASECRATPVLTVALGERLHAAIANDCGTGHMLGTAHCRLVTLFGRTSPSKFVVKGARSWRSLSASEVGVKQLADIPVTVAVKAIDALLQENQERTCPI